MAVGQWGVAEVTRCGVWVGWCVRATGAFTGSAAPGVGGCVAAACVRVQLAVAKEGGIKPMAPGQPRRLPCPLVDTEQGRVQLLVLVPVFAVAHWPTLDRAVLVLVVCLL